MDEVSRGLDEMALGTQDNNIFALREEGHVSMEACGCAELVQNESVGALSTPLHRCKGRHHLPIIGEEMKGDQPPREGKADMKHVEQAELSSASADCSLDWDSKNCGHSPQVTRSEQTTSEARAPPLLPNKHASCVQTHKTAKEVIDPHEAPQDKSWDQQNQGEDEPSAEEEFAAHGTLSLLHP